jgi:isochorismate hydrolase
MISFSIFIALPFIKFDSFVNRKRTTIHNNKRERMYTVPRAIQLVIDMVDCMLVSFSIGLNIAFKILKTITKVAELTRQQMLKKMFEEPVYAGIFSKFVI